MRGYDAFANVIKSGGKTRRAAKMQLLNMDHGDIERFIACKWEEEQKAHVLIDAGYDGSVNGEAYSSVSFQNSNHSVRVTDDDMRSRNGSEIRAGPPTRISWRKWRGVAAIQASSTPATINAWNTCDEDGEINASNPCSEYLFLDDTACNLASLNVLRFAYRNAKGQVTGFDEFGFRQAVRVMITAMDIIVSKSKYPTEKITERSNNYRTLGIGITNLGALLMSMGIPYDSDAGRKMAAEIVSIMSAEGYLQSARMAAKLGPFRRYDANRTAVLAVLEQHRIEAEKQGLGSEATWAAAIEEATTSGIRNAQISVIAPTGTISFMMDCESTGIEPIIALSAIKQMSGGGSMKVKASDCVIDGMRHTKYYPDKRGLDPQSLAATLIEFGPRAIPDFPYRDVFQTALGDNPVSVEGHLRMMEAVQPFLSGGISKTVNMPASATVEDIRGVYVEAWRLGLKSVAVYRDGSKRSQPLNVEPVAEEDGVQVEREAEEPRKTGHLRNRLPDTRASVTHHFRLGEVDGYVTVGEYFDGRPGELFIKVAKQGTALSGLLDSVGIAVSIGLQYGVPLKLLASKFKGMAFEPAGWIDGLFHPSVMSYIFDWMDYRYSDTGAPAQAEVTAGNARALSISESVGPTTITGIVCPDCGSAAELNGTCVGLPQLRLQLGLRLSRSFFTATHFPASAGVGKRSQ